MHIYIHTCMGHGSMGAPMCTLALTPTSNELTPT